MPALKGPNDEIAITMHAKEALVRAHAFPKPPMFPGREIRPAQGLGHTWITVELVEKHYSANLLPKHLAPTNSILER